MEQRLILVGLVAVIVSCYAHHPHHHPHKPHKHKLRLFEWYGDGITGNDLPYPSAYVELKYPVLRHPRMNTLPKHPHHHHHHHHPHPHGPHPHGPHPLPPPHPDELVEVGHEPLDLDSLPFHSERRESDGEIPTSVVTYTKTTTIEKGPDGVTTSTSFDPPVYEAIGASGNSGPPRPPYERNEHYGNHYESGGGPPPSHYERSENYGDLYGESPREEEGDAYESHDAPRPTSHFDDEEDHLHHYESRGGRPPSPPPSPSVNAYETGEDVNEVDVDSRGAAAPLYPDTSDSKSGRGSPFSRRPSISTYSPSPSSSRPPPPPTYSYPAPAAPLKDNVPALPKEDSESYDSKQIPILPQEKIIKNVALNQFIWVRREEGTPNVRLTLDPVRKSSYFLDDILKGRRIHVVSKERICIQGDVTEGRKAGGSKCLTDDSSIQWDFVEINHGQYWIQQTGTNLCLQPGPSFTSPRFVEMYKCDLYENLQLWELGSFSHQQELSLPKAYKQ